MSAAPSPPVRVAEGGVALASARVAVIMLHGRGASAQDILHLAAAFRVPDCAYFAPEAPTRSWWPQSFLAPLASNMPQLAHALEIVARLEDDLVAASMPRERIALVGFSQGACLALEHLARRGGRRHAVLGFSGGLVGTADRGGPDPDLYGFADKEFDYEASLDGTPVYLGCHDRDPHIPKARVERSAKVLTAHGASVRTAIHQGAAHGVTESDLETGRRLLSANAAESA